jgi:hypothetical protein
MWQALAVFGVLLGVMAGPNQILKNVMREKLVHAQKILEAVVTSDWAGLETHTRELEQLTKDARWTVLKYPEYARHSVAFVQSVQALRTAAGQRDLDLTTRAYTDVTLQCVGCHRYLARMRMAK